MAQDLVELGIRKDGADQALKEIGAALEKTATSADKAADAMDDLSNSNKGVATVTETTTRKVREYESGLDKLVKQAQRMSDGQKIVAKFQERLNEEMRAGRISQAAYDEILERATRRYLTRAEAQNRLNAMTAQQRALMDDATVSASRFQGALGNLRGGLGNLAYQFQDSLVMWQGGANAMLILSQQGSQAAMSLGALGPVIGVAAAVIGAAGMAMTSAGDAAASTGNSMEALSRSIAGQTNDVLELTRAYEGLTRAQRNTENLNLMSALSDSRVDRGAKVGEFQSAIRDSIPTYWLDFRDIGAKLKPVNDVLAKIKDGSLDAAEGLVQAETALRQTGLSAGFMDGAVLKAAGSVAEADDKVRMMEARVAFLAGTATEAQMALLGFADAAGEVARTQEIAARSLTTLEADMRAHVDALKDGETALNAYNRAQAKTEAYDTALKMAMEAGQDEWEANATAARLAGLAVEKFDATLEASANKRASGKFATATERDAKAYAGVVAELDRTIASQKGLADAALLGADAMRDANIQTEIAAALSKAHVAAGTEEAAVIGEKVRQAKAWAETANVNGAIREMEDRLALTRTELSLMGMGEDARDRALYQIGLTTEATKQFGTATGDAVEQWMRLGMEVYDNQQEIKRFEQAAEDFPESSDTPEINALFEEVLS